MGDLLTTISLANIPDIFKVAAHAWGIQVQCLCLIPEAFSVVVLFLGFIESVNILIFDNVKNKPVWFGISFSLFALIILKFFWWGQMIGVFSNIFMNLMTFLLLSQIILFFIVCFLLFKILNLSSRKLKINFLMMIVYGSGSFAIFWRYMNERLISEPILVVGESLLLVSFSYIVVFIHREYLHLTIKI